MITESSTITPEIIKFEPFEFLALEQVNEGSREDDQAPLDTNDNYDDNQNDVEQEEIIEVPPIPKPPTVKVKKKLVNKFETKRGRPSREDTIRKLGEPLSTYTLFGLIVGVKPMINCYLLFIASKNFGMTPCPLCHLKFSTGTALSTHIARSHKQNKFTCLVCSMTFSRRDYFQVHIACHSEYPLTGINTFNSLSNLGNYSEILVFLNFLLGSRVPVTYDEDPIELSSDSSASLRDSDSDFGKRI